MENGFADNNGFETTIDDFDVVAMNHGIELPDDVKERLLKKNSDMFAKAALWYDDIEEQADSVLDEIEKVLIKEGFLPKNVTRIYKMPGS